MDPNLVGWLSGLTPDALARVLANREDALGPPPPRDLDDLALRLTAPISVVIALRALPAPHLQVVRAVDLCRALGHGDGVPLAQVATTLGTTPSAIEPVLDFLSECGLAWTDNAGLVRTPSVMPDAGYQYYNLGLPLAELLPDRTADQLKQMSSALGLSTAGRKQQLVDRVLAFLREPSQVVALLADAPQSTRELLMDCAYHGPEIECWIEPVYFGNHHGSRGDSSPARWAADRGLLWATYHGTAHMPLEIGLALRGEDYRLPFDPQPPVPATTRAAADQVEAESSAAALRLADRVLGVLESASTEPIALLKSGGGVGVQVIRKLAKRLGSGTDEVRLAIELALAGRLLEPVEQTAQPVSRRGKGKPPAPSWQLVPTDDVAWWRDQGAAAQLRSLTETWWTLPWSPLADHTAVDAVLGGDSSGAFVHVRHLTVRLVAELGGAVVAQQLTPLVVWHAPAIHPDLTEALVAAVMTEATMLGVLAQGAAGQLASALVAGTGSPDFVKATDQLSAAARTTALFGTDLTAIVTGPPDSALARLLDRAADREVQGSAAIWRFSPASVRRAFDHGDTADGLIDDLGSVAAGSLPQPLTFLINDVARRHGELGVIEVGCVVVGESPGLLAEIAAHRRLKGLGLRSVAPTVLTATATPAATLAALREAGYAPVSRAADGSVLIRTRKSAPATVTPATNDPVYPTMSRPDPYEVATRLLGRR